VPANTTSATDRLVTTQSDDSSSALQTDGRRERGNRNKAAVVAALLDLYAQGEIQPPAARIAEIAKVSERSVFRYFDDMDDLSAFAVELQWSRVKDLYEDLVSDGNFSERLAAIVEQRLHLYDKVESVYQVAVLAARKNAVVASALKKRRSILRHQTMKQFAQELDNHPDSANARRILDFTLSLENVDYLKSAMGLSGAKSSETLHAAVAILFHLQH